MNFPKTQTPRKQTILFKQEKDECMNTIQHSKVSVRNGHTGFSPHQGGQDHRTISPGGGMKSVAFNFKTKLYTLQVVFYTAIGVLALTVLGQQGKENLTTCNLHFFTFPWEAGQRKSRGTNAGPGTHGCGLPSAVGDFKSLQGLNT